MLILRALALLVWLLGLVFLCGGAVCGVALERLSQLSEWWEEY